MTNKKLLGGMLAAALIFGMAAAGCDDGNGDPNNTDPGNTLPAAKGENAVSGKTYFNYDEKIEFAATADGAANGTYTRQAVKESYSEQNGREQVLVNGKYTYAVMETGFYTWDETAKTVTLSPEKIASYSEDYSIGPLQTKAEYRTAMQAEINQYIQGMTSAQINAALASMGFSSVAAYLDYEVAETFKNVTNNYAFSADNKSLFLDPALPANKGTNELSGQTYYGVSWNDDDEPVKDTNITYVFTAADCTFRYSSYDSTTYIYAYDSAAKRVYLKTPVTNRSADYQSALTNTTAGYFATADDNCAAQVNSQYGRRLDEYRYDTTDKTLRY
jgi:hypothetical protein